MGKSIQRFLNNEGKIKQLPAKQAMKLSAYKYLAERFEYDRDYPEKDVNSIICKWHTFGDWLLLRRGMVYSGYLGRTADGSKYWRNKEKGGESQG